MSLFEIMLKKLAAQRDMMAVKGTSAHTEAVRIVREYERMLTAGTISIQ